MANTSVDGLVSGLDTASLISQLMQVERQPQVRLQQRRDTLNRTIDAYQTLNTKLNAVETAAEALKSAPSWNVFKATSSDTAVLTATASSAATPGVLSVNVTNLAAAHSTISASGVASTDTVVFTGSSFTITKGDRSNPSAQATYTFTPTDGKLSSVVAAINANADAGLVASAVQVAPNDYRIQITSKTTGDLSWFTVDAAQMAAIGGSFGVVTDGADAVVHVGTGPAAYDIRSATNTVTGALPGVTMTLLSKGPATLTIDNDADALADKVSKLVAAVNDAATYIKGQSGYDSKTKTAGKFLADPMVAGVAQSLIQAVTSSVSASTLGTPSLAGVTLGRDGTLTFDKTKFLDAYAKDPAAVAKLFQENDTTVTTDDGMAERLRVLAKDVTDFTTGRITTSINSKKDQVKSLDDAIADWDVRLRLREQALRRQFTGLEAALGTLKNQSTWLSGQISGLTK